MGIRLFKYASKAMERSVKFDKVMFWSDSKIALAWIAKSPEKLKTFLSNRVKEIRANSSPDQWFHLPGELNVSADLASRGCTAEALKQNPEWLGGPNILYEEESEWEKIPGFKVRDKLTNEELNLVKEEEAEAKEVFATSQVNEADRWMREILLKYESIAKAVRVLALVRRACSLFKNKNQVKSEVKLKKLKYLATLAGTLDEDEGKNTMVEVLKLVQRGSFAEELKALKNNTALRRVKNSKIDGLNPQLDSRGLIVLGSRISHPTNEVAKIR